MPKLSVLCHASQGAGNYAMAGRTWDPRFIYAWPNSRSSIMGPAQAADVLTQVRVAGLRRRGEDPGTDEISKIKTEVTAYFESTYHSYYLTSDLRDDGLIDPIDTRNTLAMALSASLNAPIVRTPGGVLRI